MLWKAYTDSSLVKLHFHFTHSHFHDLHLWRCLPCLAICRMQEKTDLTTRCRGSYFYRYYSFYYYSGWGWRRLDSSHNSAHLFEGRRLELEHRRQLRCYLDLNDVYGYEECVCVAASMNDRYCAKWYCEEELSDLYVALHSNSACQSSILNTILLIFPPCRDLG